MQSIIGHTDKQRAQPVQLSLTNGKCVFGSNSMA